MSKRKLPTGFVMIFAALGLGLVLFNGGETLRLAGRKSPAPMHQLDGGQLSEADLAAQRNEMQKMRTGRDAQESHANSSPSLVIEPEIGNARQPENISRTVTQWWVEGSRTKDVADATEAMRGGVVQRDTD